MLTGSLPPLQQLHLHSEFDLIIQVFFLDQTFFYLPFSLGCAIEMCIFALQVFFGVLLCVPSQCLECPFGCECFAVTRTVKCVSKDLLMVPQGTPQYTRTVIITGNNIHQIGPESFAELENVTNIILSNNR